MIKALLYKDLKALKTYALIMLAVGCVIAIAINEPGFSIILTVLASGLVFTSFSLDENSGGEKEAVAIAGDRKKIIAEKYLLSLIIIGTGALIAFTFECFNGLLSNTFSLSFSLMTAIGALALGIIVCAIGIPFIIAFGAEKARMGILLLPLIAVALFQKCIEGEKLNASFIPLFLALTVMIATPVSFFASNLLFKEKEF